MDTSLSIGLSALLAAQKAINTTGHNIANTNTPDYSRQRVEFASSPSMRTGPLQPGSGVQALSIESIRDSFLDHMLLTQDPLAGAATRRNQLLGDVESLFSVDPETSLGAVIGGFFNSFRELSRNPAGSAERGAVVHQASNLAASFSSLAERLTTLQNNLLPYTQDVTDTINALSSRIAGLNTQIRDARVQGGEANDLIDQRLTALRELADLVPISVTYDDLDRANVRAGGMLIVANDDVTPLSATMVGSSIEVQVGGTPFPFTTSGGQLGSLLDVANNTLPGYIDRLDTLAVTICQEINKLHSTGVGRGGSFASLTSANAVANAAVPLAQCGFGSDLAAGDLYVAVTDEATGDVSQTKLTIDPGTDSLADLANALDGIAHLHASVGNGVLQITADGGHAFDFSNTVPTHPGTLGTATPTLAGNVTLAANDTYTFTADATGTIGTTAGLTISVTNAAGLAVAVLDVGEGYEPGQAIELPGGLTVSFDAGDIDAGVPDTLAVELASEPDEQGMLAALGLNTFFHATRAADMRLETAITANPDLIAAARSAAPGDNTNALRLAGIQDEALEALDGDSVDGYYAEFIGRVGLDAQMARRNEESATLMLEAAQNQRDSVSAVNQDEEAVRLIQFQQLYTFAARYINTVDELMDSLMSIL